jgi:FkbH-like protein
MTEAVRLVIWDLDETFWSGTLTEGGAKLIRAHADIVIELARRGIVSSICSKNNFQEVRELLTEAGLWDYFVLPSISWEPKGPRIQALIETIGLRPPTVLFIDDNPLNLQEARRFVPEIQIQSNEFVGQMLSHDLFRGKNDKALSRLKQYKVLEQRKADEASAGANVAQFLRESNIRVRLEFDVERNLERFIELINRTNQLNFTKERLPEEPSAAREAASRMLNLYSHQAALVHVQDRYGDHGYCGVYVHNSEARRLMHFAFSCRILGMGVEQWLYQKLGSPAIAVTGEVLSNLFEKRNIDWITQVHCEEQFVQQVDSNWTVNRITARGACDLGALIHYFAATTRDAVGEYHIFRNGGTFRIDHSVFLRYGFGQLSQAQYVAAAKLGYEPSDFKTRIYESSVGQDVVLLSFAADQLHGLYRHRDTGMELPFTVNVPGKTNRDMRDLTEDDLVQNGGHRLWKTRALQALRDEFDYIGCADLQRLIDNVRLTLRNIPQKTKVLILGYLESVPRSDCSGRAFDAQLVAANNALCELAQDFSNLEVINPSLIVAPQDIQDKFHFRRQGLFQLYQEISRRLTTSSVQSPNNLDLFGASAVGT